jgi:hypothetical protein
MGRSFHRAPALVLLTAACMLTACAAKPSSTVVADVVPESAASPPPAEAEPPDSVQQHAEPLSTDTSLVPPPDEATTRFVSDPATRRLLRWKFVAGDILRYETSFLDKLKIGDQEFCNERIVRFRWTVLDVHDDGTASILIAFDRVRLNLQHPQLSYDSDNETLDVERVAEANIQRELQAASSLLDSEGVMEINLRGQGTLVAGAEKVADDRLTVHFTPAGFSALPDEPVGVNDSWRVAIAGGESAPPYSGYADCLLKGEQPVGGRAVTVIEGRTSMTPMVTPASATGRLERYLSVTASRFDAAAGRFLSRTTKGSVRMKDGAGDETRKDFEVKQQWLPDASEKVQSLQALVESRYSKISAAEAEPTPRKRRGPVER